MKRKAEINTSLTTIVIDRITTNFEFKGRLYLISLYPYNRGILFGIVPGYQLQAVPDFEVVFIIRVSDAKRLKE